MAIKKSSKSTAPKSITMDQIKASQGVTASNPSGISRDQLAERAQSIVKNTSSSGRTSTGITKPVSSGGLSGLAGKTGPTGIKTPVTTSDSARSTYDAMRDRIAKMANNTGNYSAVYNNPLYQETSGMIKDQRKSLAERKTAEIGRITSDFNQRAEGQKQTQRSETGTQSMSLARIGGFDSASGQGVLTNLQRVHESEQNALMQARQSAILQAQTAYEDKDFALAKMQMDEAKAAEKLIYDRQQDFLKNTLMINQEERADLESQRAQQKFEYEMMKDNTQFALDNDIKTPFYIIGGEARDTKTGERLDMAEFIARGGDAKNFSNAFIVEPGSKEARKYAYDMASKYVDAGILPTDDPATIGQKIKNSAIYREQVRPPSSGGNDGSELNNDINSTVSSLIAKWQSSGWLNSGSIGSGEYKKAKQAWVSQYAGKLSDPGKTFDNYFMGFVNSSGGNWQSDYGIN